MNWLGFQNLYDDDKASYCKKMISISTSSSQVPSYARDVKYSRFDPVYYGRTFQSLPLWESRIRASLSL